MSSFKRAVKAPSSGPSAGVSETVTESASPETDNVVITGVKPWVNTGLGIVSSGNKQLDELIGGGSALGTLTLIESDSFSNYGETLALYGLAESISHKHPILLVSEDHIESERIMAAIPYNQTIGSTSGSGENIFPTAESTEANKLTIAWQYGKYIKKEEAPVRRSSSGEAPPASYCCSYDLSRRLQASILESATVEICSASALSTTTNTTPTTTHTTTHTTTAAELALGRIVQAVREFLQKHHKNPKCVSRIVISSLDQALSAVGDNTHSPLTSATVAKFVLQLKHLIRSHRVSLLVYANPNTLTDQTAAKLRHVADTVLSVESFAGRTHSVPYEFKDFQGFLVVHKLQQYGTLAPFRPPGTRFGLKRDRRKLHIEPLHLPPEESRAFSTTGGAEKPAVGTVSSVGSAGSVSGVIGVSSGGDVGGAEGVKIHQHSHTDSHSSHSTKTGATSSVANTASTTQSSAEAPAPAPVKLTPLQASLAALKAARLNAAAPSTVSSVSSVGSVGSTVSGVAPVSIQRHVAAAPAANIVNKKADAQPPLQPGQACGAQSRSGTTDSVYDF